MCTTSCDVKETWHFAKIIYMWGSFLSQRLCVMTRCTVARWFTHMYRYITISFTTSFLCTNRFIVFLSYRLNITYIITIIMFYMLYYFLVHPTYIFTIIMSEIKIHYLMCKLYKYFQHQCVSKLIHKIKLSYIQSLYVVANTHSHYTLQNFIYKLLKAFFNCACRTETISFEFRMEITDLRPNALLL
jgi:hypothetical protein